MSQVGRLNGNQNKSDGEQRQSFCTDPYRGQRSPAVPQFRYCIRSGVFFFCCHLRQCSPCFIASIFVAKPGYIRLNFRHFFSSRFCSYASRRPQSFICRLFMVMSSFLFSHSGFIVLFSVTCEYKCYYSL